VVSEQHRFSLKPGESHTLRLPSRDSAGYGLKIRKATTTGDHNARLPEDTPFDTYRRGLTLPEALVQTTRENDRKELEMRYVTRADFEAFLFRRAWEDPNFLDELRTNPKAVLADELGTDQLPEHLEIEVLEETPDKLYLIIPMRPDPEAAGQALASRALAGISEEDLDQAVTDARQLFSTRFCWSE
jgi:hypothetical protein